jgi:ParB family chromosome partitioning protein
VIEQPAGRRRGLGRGLELLIGPAVPADELVTLPVGSVHPNRRQPRRRFEVPAIAELAESIRVQGVVQPVLVRVDPAGGYELIAGERRWRAARAAGLATVPAILREADERDSLVLALVENVAREDLSPVEEARAYAVLQDEFSLTLGEIAERVGRSKPAISNRLRLLELPDDVLELVDKGELSEGHARVVLSVPGNEERRRFARRIVKRGQSVRAAERLARAEGARTRPRKRGARADAALVERARSALEELVGVPIRAAPGRLEVPFADEVALGEIVESLEAAAGALRAGRALKAATLSARWGD